MRYLLVLASIILIAICVTASFFVLSDLPKTKLNSPFYLGVTFCGETSSEAKALIDRIEPYTNLFVLQSFPLSTNETAINEICNYAVAHGLHIIINLGTYRNATTWPWQLQLLKDAPQHWGNMFLGAYFGDEPGGVQLDFDWQGFFDEWAPFFETNASSQRNFNDPDAPLHQMYLKFQDARVNGTKPQNYNLEEQVFIDYLTNNYTYLQDLNDAGITTFVSDYALYWFDYLGGYDVLLTQLGTNSSTAQNIAMVRGAARLQNKEWGAIITWKYDAPPYLETGDEVYSQMLSAYEAGAKYVIVFNYPKIEGNPYGVMTDGHFKALEKLYNKAMATSMMQSLSDSAKAEAALVLPFNYGWGMRNANDKIWGFWGPDEKSPQIWDLSRKLLSQYDYGLDIIYDDPAFPIAGKYPRIYYWNATL